MKPASRHDVYAALTTDYGVGMRDAATQADNVLDLNGLLHVEHVTRFCDALMRWRGEVIARNAADRGQRAAKEEIRRALKLSAARR